jgi:hypothetical protein
LRSIQHDPALNRELLDRLLGPLLEATRQRIVRGQHVGQIDAAVDPAIAVELLFGPMFHRWLLRTGPLDDAYGEALAEHGRSATPVGLVAARIVSVLSPREWLGGDRARGITPGRDGQ